MTERVKQQWSGRAAAAARRWLRLATLAGLCLVADPPCLASEFELPAPSVEQERWLNDDELADRLAGFLWHAAPDEELRALAAGRQLHRPELLRSQAARLLADPRSRDFVNAFLGHWLELNAPAAPAVSRGSDAGSAAVDQAQAHVFRLIRENQRVSALLSTPVPLLRRSLAARVPHAMQGSQAPVRLARSLVRSFLEHARGAPLHAADALAVDDILARSKVDGFRLGTLIHEVVQSELFQTR
jgi:hypothetical protein